ncbi:hypothetical protein LCGC14_1859120 [marine sediment metagenome]|uniref:Uncharacterized protein n=1 Tax=marine sediment metagenome TaxID=412755 RepID=A0A0F9J738_9ZZZZ
MKSYSCKICVQRGESFSGIRPLVRKHLREEHLIRGGQITVGKPAKEIGRIAHNMIVVDLD